MSQTGYTPIQSYYSKTAGVSPAVANLVDGELAINTADGKLFYKDSTGALQVIASKASVTNVASLSAGTTGLSVSSSTGAVTLDGTVNVAHGGTGANSLLGYVKGNGTGAMTATGTIPTTDLLGTITNTQLANNSVTVNGSAIALGGSATIKASTTNALTINAGLSGVSFDGGAATTIGIADTAVVAGVYGTASSVPAFTVNSRGQLTAAGNVAIAIAAAAVSGLAASATVDTTNAANITSGVLAVARGGSGAGTLTGYVKGNGTAAMTASATIPTTDLSGTVTNAQLANSSVSFNGVSVALGASGTLKASTTNALTIGTGLSGATFDGSVAKTIALADTAVTAGTYGSITSVPTFTVDAQGRLVTASNAAIAISSSQITNVGVANGLVPLGADTKIAAQYLPSYVDDVIEGADFASFPVTGETGKIYVDAAASKIYRWSGTVYIEISPTAGNSDSATKLATARTIAITGDASWSVSFDGSGNASGALTLANTAVVAGSYGAADSVATFTVDAKGRLTAAGTTSIALAASAITSGILSVARGGTGAGTLTGYVKGNGTGAMTASAGVPTTDLTGTVSNAQLANSSVTINGSVLSLGGVATVKANTNNALTIGTGLSGVSFDGSSAATVAIANTAVAAGSYGSASSVTTLTVNAQGQLTAAASTPIAIASGAVSGLAASATTDTTNATNISSGTLAVARGGSGATTTTGTGANVLGTAPSISGMLQSAQNGVSAAGTTQATATALTGDIVVVSTVAAGAGVVLAAAAAGKSQMLVNKGANAVLVYPAGTDAIDALAAGVAISVPAGSWIEFTSAVAGQWYSSFNAAVSTANLVGVIDGGTY